MILISCVSACDVDRKALKLSPLLWSNFDSLCNSGENVDPNIIWEKDPESLETLEYCTGANPVMNLINCSASAGQTTPAQGVLPTPVRQQTVSKVAGGDKVTLATPQPPTPLISHGAPSSPPPYSSPPPQKVSSTLYRWFRIMFGGGGGV